MAAVLAAVMLGSIIVSAQSDPEDLRRFVALPGLPQIRGEEHVVPDAWMGLCKVTQQLEGFLDLAECRKSFRQFTVHGAVAVGRSFLDDSSEWRDRLTRIAELDAAHTYPEERIQFLGAHAQHLFKLGLRLGVSSGIGKPLPVRQPVVDAWGLVQCVLQVFDGWGT